MARSRLPCLGMGVQRVVASMVGESRRVVDERGDSGGPCKGVHCRQDGVTPRRLHCTRPRPTEMLAGLAQRPLCRLTYRLRTIVACLSGLGRDFTQPNDDIR